LGDGKAYSRPLLLLLKALVDVAAAFASTAVVVISDATGDADMIGHGNLCQVLGMGFPSLLLESPHIPIG